MIAPAVTRGRRLERARIVRMLRRAIVTHMELGHLFHATAMKEAVAKIVTMPKPKGSSR